MGLGILAALFSTGELSLDFLWRTRNIFYIFEVLGPEFVFFFVWILAQGKGLLSIFCFLIQKYRQVDNQGNKLHNDLLKLHLGLSN